MQRVPWDCSSAHSFCISNPTRVTESLSTPAWTRPPSYQCRNARAVYYYCFSRRDTWASKEHPTSPPENLGHLWPAEYLFALILSLGCINHCVCLCAWQDTCQYGLYLFWRQVRQKLAL